MTEEYILGDLRGVPTLSSHQNSNEVSAASPSTTNGALVFLIVDHASRMTVDVVADAPADDGPASRHRDDTLAVKAAVLFSSPQLGPWTGYKGLN